MKQLRFTTTEPYSFLGGLLGDPDTPKPLVDEKGVVNQPTKPLKGKSAYIHGAAEELAGFDIPKFISGDLDQLGAPQEEQDIVLVLPWTEIPCISTYHEGNEYYLLTSKPIFKNPPKNSELILSTKVKGLRCDIYRDYDANKIIAKLGDAPKDKTSCKIEPGVKDAFWFEVFSVLAANKLAIKNI